MKVISLTLLVLLRINKDIWFPIWRSLKQGSRRVLLPYGSYPPSWAVIVSESNSIHLLIEKYLMGTYCFYIVYDTLPFCPSTYPTMLPWPVGKPCKMASMALNNDSTWVIYKCPIRSLPNSVWWPGLNVGSGWGLSAATVYRGRTHVPVASGELFGGSPRPPGGQVGWRHVGQGRGCVSGWRQPNGRTGRPTLEIFFVSLSLGTMKSWRRVTGLTESWEPDQASR